MGAFQCGDDAFELSQFVGGADGLVVIYGENDGALLCGKVGILHSDNSIGNMYLPNFKSSGILILTVAILVLFPETNETFSAKV